MHRLAFTAAALADSRNILDTLIEVAGQRVAAAYLARFSSALDRLRMFPQSGAPRPGLGAGIRMAVVHPYLLFYRATDDEVQVVRVLHGRQKITRRTMR